MPPLPARILATIAAVLVALAGVPDAAHAAGMGMAPYFVEYGSGMTTYVGQHGSTAVPIGVNTWGSGTATNVKLTVDLSQITAKVDIIGVSSPCSRSGSKVTCNYGTLKISGTKKFGATLSLRAKSTAIAGMAGKVSLTLSATPTPGDTSASGTVHVSPDVADLVLSSTSPVVQIGQTVTLSHTITNRGPAVEPWTSIGAGGVQPGTTYVGGEGCSVAAKSFTCRIENLGVGQTRVVKVKVKINGCDATQGTTGPAESWGAAIDDPNMTNNDFRVLMRVQGCPGPTGASGGSMGGSTGGSSGSSGGSPKPGAQASAAPAAVAPVSPSAVASAPASASAEPTGSPSAAAAPAIAEVAATTSNNTAAWLTVAGALGLAALLGLAWRRRRQAAPAGIALTEIAPTGDEAAPER